LVSYRTFEHDLFCRDADDLRALHRSGKPSREKIIRVAGTSAGIMRLAAPTHLLTVLVAGLALAGCAAKPQLVTDSPGLANTAPAGATSQPAPAGQLPAPVAGPTSQPATTQPPPAQPVAAPQPAGRGARAPTVPAQPATGDEPMTTTRAREQCWMLAEGQRARDIDSRVKFVEQCVKDKMK
jgi:hypothetical protein